MLPFAKLGCQCMSKLNVCCKMRLLYLLLQVYCSVSSYGSVKYCGARMCGYTDSHTFCQYPAGPGSSCYGFVPSLLSIEEKERVLDRMNKRRSEIAQGLRLPPAGDMLKLRWVSELEREAQRWADQCRTPASMEEHDTCRDLYSISVGQCVASVLGEAPGLRPETMVDMWFMQSMHYHGNISEYRPPTTVKNFYGDFAQMTWSRTYMVGCGRSRFMITSRGRLRTVERLVCNFAPRGPLPSHPLWLSGEPASACPPRSYPDHEMVGICTYQLDNIETSDLNQTDNNFEENLLLAIVLELERNDSLNGFGKLDEIYLTKLAMATLDNPIKEYNSVQKRYVHHEDNEKDSEILLQYENNFKPKDLAPNYYKIARNYDTLGGLKSYNVEDLINTNNSVDIATYGNPEIYVDIEFEGKQSNYILTTFEVSDGILNEDSTTDYKSNVVTDNTPKVNKSNVFGKMLNEVISNLSVVEYWNESVVDEKLLDDYLSDPETAKELQAAIERMEQKLTSSTSAHGKVRREIRNSEDLNDIELAKEIERNRTRDRGPMLNMMLKYIPYLKTYENTIVGDTFTNSAFTVVRSLILQVLFVFIIEM